MPGQSVAEKYAASYEILNFERGGLFAALQKRYPLTTVLYPGCHFHLTPSFYFPHVVYVDRSSASAAFFGALSEIQAFVDRRKRYRRSAYIQFFLQDYTQPIPVRTASFDLLISLFGGRISQACAGYLKPGGLLLSNDPADLPAATRDPRFEFVAALLEKEARYTWSARLPATSSATCPGTGLKSGNRGLEYAGDGVYALFRKNEN